MLGGAGEEGWGEGLKVLGGRGGYGSGLGDGYWEWIGRRVFEGKCDVRELQPF